MSLDMFSRRWQSYVADYSMERLKFFVKFSVLAYVQDLRAKAAIRAKTR